MSDQGLKVLVIDDSAVVRETVSRLLGRLPGWEVTTAMDSVVALERLRKDRPHVILLDLEMPRMDGLTFLRHVMATDPLPVVVCSGHADHGTQAAITALELGAVSILPKPKLAVRSFLEDSGAELIETLRRAAEAGPSLQPAWPHTSTRSLPPMVLGRPRMVPAQGTPASEGLRDPKGSAPPEPVSAGAERSGTGEGGIRKHRLVLLGASMGGAEAVHRIVSTFPADGPACLVTLHMPEPFTAAFAQRLNSQVAMQVREAREGDAALPGRVLVAPGGRHMTLRRGVKGPEVELTDGPPVKGHRPSIDVLFRSAAEVVGRTVVAALLTGMGEDGAEGLLALRKSGAWTLVQDRATSTVFGMPKAALDLSAAREMLPLDGIGPRLLDLTGTDIPEGGEASPETGHPSASVGNGTAPEVK